MSFQISQRKNHQMKKAIASALLITTPALIVQGQTAPLSSDENRRVGQEVRRLNTEEVEAFLHKDGKTLASLWSDDLVVTNPLNKFVSKQQVLGMVESGFLVITSYDRQIEYVRAYGDTVIVVGSETLGKDAERRKNRASSFHRYLDETGRSLARGRPACQHRASAMTQIAFGEFQPELRPSHTSFRLFPSATRT